MPPWNGDVRRPSISLKTEVSSSSSPSLGMRREGVAVCEKTREIYNRGCTLVDLVAPPVTSSTLAYRVYVISSSIILEILATCAAFEPERGVILS